MRSTDIDTTLDALSAQARSRARLDEGSAADLLRRARGEPGGSAEGELVERNLDIVLDAALAHRDEAIDVADLFQEGSVALIRAVAAYACADGAAVGLRSHLRIAVDGHLDQVVERARELRRSDEALVRDARTLDLAQMAMRRRLGHEAAPEELARALEWETDRVELVLRLLEDARRLDDETLLPFLDDEDGG